ncbi:MAG: hypothetical protein HXY18_17140 [Bryobacteraceae bacterium]|nr:hypothetical protein [Bryobacteraceae bacterium]
MDSKSSRMSRRINPGVVWLEAMFESAQGVSTTLSGAEMDRLLERITASSEFPQPDNGVGHRRLQGVAGALVEQRKSGPCGP